MTNRWPVAKSRPDVLQRLATELHSLVEDTSKVFEILFDAYREGQAGEGIANVTDTIFGGWCAESYITPIRRLTKELNDRYNVKTHSANDFAQLFSERNFTTEESSKVADALSDLARRNSWNKVEVIRICWTLYQQAIKKLCVQTGHVVVARFLLYRIGEDSGMFQTRLSGQELERTLIRTQSEIGNRVPALILAEQVRSQMEQFLPSIYRMGEFDWWYISADKHSAMKPRTTATISILEKELDLAFQRILRTLNSYFFKNVDVDVWRNIYQHYMPWEERQRLGGFYTPEELVDLVLDLVGYNSEDRNLAMRTFIDPASGSGAFVASALARLLKNLKKYGPPGMPSGRQPEWIRAKYELETIQRCLHAIDIHPFAAFLTTLNVLFLVLTKYKIVKDKNPNFVFEPTILAHDSLLLTPEEVTLFERIEVKMNGRVKRAEEDHRRYIELLKKKFDFVIGNPPWSGILKGPLAAIYDEQAKKRIKETYKGIAKGKYDIYGVFIDRAIRFLKPSGRFGLVTQDTYLEKAWASGIRQKLSSDTTIEAIVDLNPFGQLFFKAMNTPAITVAKNEEPSGENEILVVVTNKPDLRHLDQAERRNHVHKLLKEALTEAIKSGRSTKDFIRAFKLEQSNFWGSGKQRWNLAEGPYISVTADNSWISMLELMETFQGVTPGGKGCLKIYLMDVCTAAAAGYEKELLHPVIKGIDVKAWCCTGSDRVIIYPYEITEERAIPAFDLAKWKASQKSIIKETLRTLEDAIDFSIPIDETEKSYFLQGTLNDKILLRLLLHRQGLGLVEYPVVARYLVSYYQILQTRIFKKRNIRSFNRRWYEYIWPRDSKVMLCKPKIISPRLTRHVRFALDTKGIIPQDSCIAISCTASTKFAWNKFKKEIEKVSTKRITDHQVYEILLAFLNSEYAQKLLITGRMPTPKGSYQITEDFLSSVRMPALTSKSAILKILNSTKALCGSQKAKHNIAQAQINNIINKLTNAKRD